jgi:peptidoglycan hydrolase CwlO-like protein
MERSPQFPVGRNGDPAEIASSQARRGPGDSWGDTPAARTGQASGGQITHLQAENEELRAMIAELRQQLSDSGNPSQGSWEEREREYETVLEEKSEEIRLLYTQIQERERKAEEGAAARSSRPARSESGDTGDTDLNTLAEELAADKARLEDEREQLRAEREQLRQDEEDMERRMQEMELQTAKSRADLVKQRNELHRMYNEVRAELEQAKQNGAVSDRVESLEREAQALSSRAGGGRE